MSKAPGTATPMPVTGAACGIKPSKEAMEVDFGIDFSKAKHLLTPNQDDSQDEITPAVPNKP